MLFVERSHYHFRVCMAVCVLVCACMPMHVSVCFRVQVIRYMCICVGVWFGSGGNPETLALTLPPLACLTDLLI